MNLLTPPQEVSPPKGPTITVRTQAAKSGASGEQATLQSELPSDLGKGCRERLLCGEGAAWTYRSCQAGVEAALVEGGVLSPSGPPGSCQNTETPSSPGEKLDEAPLDRPLCYV